MFLQNVSIHPTKLHGVTTQKTVILICNISFNYFNCKWTIMLCNYMKYIVNFWTHDNLWVTAYKLYKLKDYEHFYRIWIKYFTAYKKISLKITWLHTLLLLCTLELRKKNFNLALTLLNISNIMWCTASMKLTITKWLSSHSEFDILDLVLLCLYKMDKLLNCIWHVTHCNKMHKTWLEYYL
jgi:hypothetical protein